MGGVERELDDGPIFGSYLVQKGHISTVNLQIMPGLTYN